jgi:glycosyltransferase involved in cell wall biosynthesis
MRALPFVSVVMPVRNEARFISRSVGAVLAQDYPMDRVEILIADGMSIDGTRAVLDELQQTHANLAVVDNPGQIVSTGLNKLVARARGEFVVRIDGHCEIAPDYVRRCVEHLLSDGIEGVGGPLNTIGETPVAQAIAVAMSSPFGVGNSAFRTVDGRSMLTDTVAFPAYRREILERSGPFDTELVRNQDDEYNYRLRKAGARLLLAADVRSRYYSRSSLRSLWRQYFQYGYWKVRVLQKHPWQMRLRQFVPPIFVATLLAALAAGAVSATGRAALAGAGSAYLCANLAATVIAGRRLPLRSWPYLSAAFAALHLAYGSGFLVGLIRFAGRWRSTGEQEWSAQTS